MPDIRKILKDYWKYTAFRPLQEEIIQSVLKGNDTLALLPTGGGKSVCFQVPALAKEGVCIVISPLIALMKDQVEQLQKRGIPAYAIHSGLSQREIDILLDNARFGNVKFLYVSPERLKTELFQIRAKEMNIGLLAIDEAHCISQWGYDFRPPYLEIAQFRELIPDVPCIALTATATKNVKLDIQEKLNFHNGQLFQKSFARPNLSYSVFDVEDKEKKLLEILTNVKGSAVVYVRSRKRTKQFADFLKRHGISADFYNAGLNHQTRSQKQDAWIANKIRVIVATNAFGMGIDKPDVRVVVHIDLPDNLEAYYQEAGRAGRDEKKAYAVILYQQKDLDDLETKISQSYPEISVIKDTYQRLANYYKIASGSGELASFDFDIDDFTSIYKLSQVATFYALQKLEEQGFIQLSEDFHSPSKILFLIDHKALYQFQVANAQFDPFIKMLLRIYGGELFNNFMKISEKKIAHLFKIPVAQVKENLQKLHQLGVLIYESQKEKPQLTFLRERFPAQSLPFDTTVYNQRKAQAIGKVKSVIQYVTTSNRCRTLQLLEYFDELSNENCGVCDYCINQKKANRYAKESIKYETKIIDLLKNNSLSLDDLITQINPKNKNNFLEEIKSLVAFGELKYNEFGELELV